MQNDVLKNEIAPWQEKGRWYHGVWDIATAAFETDKTDNYILTQLDIVIGSSAAYAHCKKSTDRLITSVLQAVDKITASTTVQGTINILRIRPQGDIGLAFAPVNAGITAGKYDIYIFIKHV